MGEIIDCEHLRNFLSLSFPPALAGLQSASPVADTVHVTLNVRTEITGGGTRLRMDAGIHVTLGIGYCRAEAMS